MKKLISAVLAVVLVLSLSVTAFATGGGHGGTICSEAKTFTFTKDYVDAEGDAAARKDIKFLAPLPVFNADGSEGKMCGNAIRCVGKYLYDKRGVKKEEVTVETLSGVKTLKLFVLNGAVTSARVDMGAPVLSPEKIPALFTGERTVGKKVILDKERVITLVSMGNPHCVVFVEDVETLPLTEIGPKFEQSPLFPERVNTEFIQGLGPREMKMRVWERGSGETMACGTGACAAVAAAVQTGRCPQNQAVTVHLKGGDLSVVYTEHTVTMEGGAELAFTGEIEMD